MKLGWRSSWRRQKTGSKFPNFLSKCDYALAIHSRNCLGATNTRFSLFTLASCASRTMILKARNYRVKIWNPLESGYWPYFEVISCAWFFVSRIFWTHSNFLYLKWSLLYFDWLIAFVLDPSPLALYWIIR